MFFFIFSIFIVSPDTIASSDDEIVIFFDEKVFELCVFLDDKIILGEMTEDYFYYQSEEPLREGKHTLLIISDDDTIFYNFNVSLEFEKENLNILNIGIGILYNTFVDTTFYPVYKEGKYFIFNLDFDLYYRNFNISGSFFKDPEYYYSFFGLMNLKNKFIEAEIGIISPLFEELTLYGLTGIGGILELKLKNLTFYPFYLYSFEKDTLISEYKRVIFGGRFWIDSLFSTTIMKGFDDTSDIEGIPLFFPQEGILISSYLGIPFKITPYLNIAYSIGSFNRFDTLNSKGLSYQLGIKHKTISLFYRFTDSSYVPIGNPFLEKDYLISLSVNLEVLKFNNNINIDFFPYFKDINLSRFNGIIILSKEIKPFNFNLSLSHSEDNYYNLKSTSLSTGLSYKNSLLLTSVNPSFTTSDTNNYFSISTANSFSIQNLYINMNLQYSNRRYNYHMSTLINLFDIGLSIEIGGFYENGKHQESYRGSISRYF